MNKEEISAGYVMVPVEPTQEMLAAGIDRHRPQTMGGERLALLYRAMLAVAPSFPRRSSVVDGLVVTVINPDSRTTSEYVVTANDVIALWDKLDVMNQCADNYSQMFEESAEECEHLKDCQENDMLYIAGLVAERDTLRQQLADRDATIARLEAGIPRIQEQSHQMRQQRDRLAKILLDAALAEVAKEKR